MSVKLAIFGLPRDIKDNEVEDLFSKFGRCHVSIRNTRAGDIMAFAEFQDRRDAQDALRERHGYKFAGEPIRVEFSEPKGFGKDKGSKGKGKRGDSRGRRDSRGRGRRDSRDRYGGGKYGGGKYGDYKGKGKGFGKDKGGKAPQLRDDYCKVRVSELPKGASWQDLKDFLRKGGEVKFADIDRNDPSIGIGGFVSEREVQEAVDKLDDTEFTTRDGEKNHVRVEEFGGGAGAKDDKRGRSRSRSGRRSQSGRSHSR